MRDVPETKDISVVFFGSGPVAARCLELLAANFKIEAVVTKPRPAHHHSHFPVIDWCDSNAIKCGKVYTVTNKMTLSKLFASRQFDSQLGIVIDFGIIIAQDVINALPMGIINSHFSLLPQWRGADPISFAVLSGQATTGVSLMLITAGLDEGPLLSQTTYSIPTGTTTPQLTGELIKLSNNSLQKFVPLYFGGVTTPAPQTEVTLAASNKPTYSRKLTKDDGYLDFHKSAQQLEREIRAFIGWPGSRATLAERVSIITAAHVAPNEQPAASIGTIWRDGKQFGFYTSDGILVIDQLKPAGKAEMSAEAFLAGYKI